ncbi:response regulator transcription factor [Gemmata palustris]|uniref:response regulator transcription factor n=1 Tax=Gemmata palustris TaxID=2822762 RepID=UPI001FE51C68|nr:response regulator [Gemmata palustris]
MIPFTVFIVDDDPEFRTSVSLLLGSVNLPVQEFESGDRFLQEVGAERPGCVVLDLRMPGLSGLAVLDRLGAREVALPAILVTGYGDVTTTVRAMRAGAVHVLEKPFGAQDLLDAVQEALSRDAKRRNEHAQRSAALEALGTLSPRERAILDRIAVGKANKNIASELQVSEKNIEFHRAKVMRKLRVTSVAELIRFAILLEIRGRR